MDTASVAKTDWEIVFNEVYFQKKHKTILENISLQIKKGDFITIIGPNGAGKSTLMKLMIGVLKPTNGTLTRKPKLKQAYMPQKFLVPSVIPLKVQDFLKLGNQVSQNEIEESLQFFHLDSLKNTLMSDLSGGENQKILLARALLQKPDILFMDEPGQNLDIKGLFKLYSLIQDFHQKTKCSIVMISHDLHFVMSTSNHVICLYKHICCQGMPEKITRDTAFLDIFGEEMKQIMSVYPHLTHNHDHSDKN